MFLRGRDKAPPPSAREDSVLHEQLRALTASYAAQVDETAALRARLADCEATIRSLNAQLARAQGVGSPRASARISGIADDASASEVVDTSPSADAAAAPAVADDGSNSMHTEEKVDATPAALLTDTHTHIRVPARASPFFEMQLRHAAERFTTIQAHMTAVVSSAKDFDTYGARYVEAGERLAAAVRDAASAPWAAGAALEPLQQGMMQLCMCVRDLGACVRAVTSSVHGSLGSSIEISMFAALAATQAALRRALAGSEVAEATMLRLVCMRKGASVGDVAARAQEAAVACANHELSRMDAVIAVQRMECSWRTGLADRIATVMACMRACARQLADVVEEHEPCVQSLSAANDAARRGVLARERVWRLAREELEQHLGRCLHGRDDASGAHGDGEAGAASSRAVSESERVIGVGLSSGTEDAGVDPASLPAAVQALRRLQQPIDSMHEAVRASSLSMQAQLDACDNAAAVEAKPEPLGTVDAVVPACLWPASSPGIRVAGWLFKRSTNSVLRQWLPRWFFVRGDKLFYIGGDDVTPKLAAELVTCNVREINAVIGFSSSTPADTASAVTATSATSGSSSKARAALSAVAGTALAAFSVQSPAPTAKSATTKPESEALMTNGDTVPDDHAVPAHGLDAAVMSLGVVTTQSYAYSHAFEVLAPSKTLVLATPTLSQRHAWVQALRGIAESALTGHRGAASGAAVTSRRGSVDGTADSAPAVVDGVEPDTPLVSTTPLLPLLQRLETGIASATDVATCLRAIRAANPRCVDCDAQNPDWASINLGCVFCVACSGVHRSLGVHVSKVRSLVLDEWDAQHAALVLRLGNAVVNAVFEADMASQPGWHRPATDAPRSERERFIRAKYEHRAFVQLDRVGTLHQLWRRHVAGVVGDAALATWTEELGATPMPPRRRRSVLAAEEKQRVRQSTELLIAASRIGDVPTMLFCIAAGAVDETCSDEASPLLRATDATGDRPAHTYAPIQDAALYGQLSATALLAVSHGFSGAQAVGATTRHVFAPLAALTWAIIHGPLQQPAGCAAPCVLSNATTDVHEPAAWPSSASVALGERTATLLLQRLGALLQLDKLARSEFMRRVEPILQARFGTTAQVPTEDEDESDTAHVITDSPSSDEQRERAVELFRTTFLRPRNADAAPVTSPFITGATV